MSAPWTLPRAIILGARIHVPWRGYADTSEYPLAVTPAEVPGTWCADGWFVPRAEHDLTAVAIVWTLGDFELGRSEMDCTAIAARLKPGERLVATHTYSVSPLPLQPKVIMP